MILRKNWILILSGLLAAAAAIGWFSFRRTRFDGRVYRIGWMISPPFQVLGPDGGPAGISVDLVNQAARRRGIALEWMFWKNSSESALVSRSVDLWPLITITPERLRVLHISDPYLQHDHCLLVRSDKSYSKPQDLTGAKIGVANVSIDARTLRTVLPTASPVPRTTIEGILNDVCTGDSEAAFMDRFTAMTALLRYRGCGGPSLRWISIPELRTQLGVGSTLEASAAADAIREEIGVMAEEGKLAGIFGQWGFMSGEDVSSVESLVHARRREVRLIAVAVIFALMFLVACWQTLRVVREKNRNQRTEEALRQSQERYLQAQKLESIGRLAGGVAHDFNNLLTVINGYSDVVYNQLSEADPRRVQLDEVRKAGARAADLTHQLLAFARKQVSRPRPLDLNTVVSESEKMLRRLLGEDVRLSILLDSALGPVMADPGQIHQVLMNLAVNARDAMPDGGMLSIETANVQLDASRGHAEVESRPDAAVCLTVSDTGAGMNEETRKNIFEPFFTTKGAKGTGLGLATVNAIVQQSQGWISVASEPGKGSAFHIYLPRVEGVADPTSSSAPPATGGAHGSETILVVEDEAEVRAFLVKALSSHGYRVLGAADGVHALELAGHHAGTIDVLLTDVVLPGMNGRELADRFRILRPGIKVLFTSGYTQDLIANRGVLHRDVDYIPKPYTAGEIAAKVREVIQKTGSGN